jgi:hypothetical protein
VGAVTVASGVSAKLQTCSGQDSSNHDMWVDAKLVAVTTTGVVSLSLNVEVVADQVYMPLRPKGRIVVSTGSGDSVGFISIKTMQGE